MSQPEVRHTVIEGPVRSCLGVQTSGCVNIRSHHEQARLRMRETLSQTENLSLQLSVVTFKSLRRSFIVKQAKAK